jgi:uncharacterized protein YndB with AHSA1/START domain
VLLWDPPHRLAFTWHPGRPHGPLTEVDVTFQPDDDGTQVLLRHSGWERLGDAAGSARESYDSVGGWTMVVDSFVRHATVA